jgi:hypothetical protein
VLKEARDAFQELHRLSRRYRLDQALARVSQIAIDEDHPEEHSTLPSWLRAGWGYWLDQAQAAYIAKALIVASNDYRGEELTFEAYAHCAELFDTALIFGGPTDDQSRQEDRFLQERFSQTMFKRMFPRWLRVARTLVLFADLAARPELSTPFDIPSAFERLTGLSIEEFMGVGQAAYVLAFSGPGPWTHAEFVEILHLMCPQLSPEQIEQFVTLVSTDYRQFRDRCDGDAVDNPQHGLYSYNPLEHTPLVRTQRSGYVIPVPSLFEDRISLGLYDDLQRAYGSTFTAAFGHVFEAYVGWLLRSVYPPAQVIGERFYGTSRQFLSTDWVIREGDTAVLIECKVTRLSAESRYSQNEPAMRRDLARGIARALIQLDRVMHDMRVGAPGLESFSTIRTFVPVVLVNDPYYAANSDEARAVVAEELRAAGVMPFFHQVLSIEDLEYSLLTLRQHGLAATLQHKMTAPGGVRANDIFPRQAKQSQWDAFRDRELGPPYEWNMREFLNWAFPASERDLPKCLDERHRRFLDQLISAAR